MSSNTNKSVSWYRKANEFVGPGASYSDSDAIGTIQDTKVRNVSNEQLPADLHSSDLETKFTSGVPLVCPKCKTEIEPFEIKEGLRNDDGDTVYQCANCGHTNNQYKMTVKKDRSRVKRRKRRHSRTSGWMRVATPGSGASNPNPANTPWGRQDFSEDTRVIPWNKIHPDYEHSWELHKQKPRVNFKLKKIKGKDGKFTYIKIKEELTGVQPANTYFQRGKIRQHFRYHPEKGRSGSEGSWSHNKAPTPDDGWYGSTAEKNRFNVDMQERCLEWSEFRRDSPANYVTTTSPR